MNVVRVDADAALERSGRALRDGGLIIVVRKAFLEGFHALGDVSHQVGNLALASEQEERNRAEQHPMPNAKATHGRRPIARRPVTTASASSLWPERKRATRQKQAC